MTVLSNHAIWRMHKQMQVTKKAKCIAAASGIICRFRRSFDFPVHHQISTAPRKSQNGNNYLCTSPTIATLGSIPPPQHNKCLRSHFPLNPGLTSVTPSPKRTKSFACAATPRLIREWDYRARYEPFLAAARGQRV